MKAPTHSDLLLTKQTFVALTDGMLVFLDLHRDKYSCLERRHTKPVCRLLGLPVEEEAESEPSDYQDDKQVVQDLVDYGLVTRDPKEGRRAEFVTQYSELKEMLGYFPGEGPKVGFGDVVKFVNALIVTKTLLRFASMQRIIARVKHRKYRFYAKGGAAPDDERLNELVELYKILKPLILTVEDQCLFNSLLLIEFLACYRAYPNWYFGVRLNDFYAHCWVQEKNAILDDTVDRTCLNEPIMVV